MEVYQDTLRIKTIKNVPPTQAEVIQKAQIKIDEYYSENVINGIRTSIDEKKILKEEQEYRKSDWGKIRNKRLAQFDAFIDGIEDPELADYLIICSTRLFGKPEPEELRLIREYKKKFGNVKKIYSHINEEN